MATTLLLCDAADEVARLQYFLLREAPEVVVEVTSDPFRAVEIAARYGEIRIDPNTFPTFANPDAAAQRARSGGVGLNWHFARNVKLVVDYERTNFSGGAAAGANRRAENFFVTRLQTAF